MEIIILVGGIIAFIYLTSRINSLERKLESKVGSIVQPTSQPQVMTAQPVSQPDVAYSPAPQTSPVTTTPVSTTSSEELGGRWLGKIGIAAVLIGVSFFLKYAFDNNIIGVGGRIALGIIGGLVLIGIGLFLRSKYKLYSDVLMGGGIGILYLTIYASYGFYHLISQPVALAVIALVTLVSVVLSVIDNAPTLAVVGIVGGFVTPIFMTSGENNLLSLFTYILVLDIGVLVTSIYKRWMKLNYIAFVGTITMFLNWYGRFYNREQLGTALFFLTIYFVVFLIVTISHHIFRKEKTTNADYGLITINAIGYFGMGYLLLNDEYHAVMGFFAVLLALLYLVVSYLVWITNPENRALNLYMPGFAILFLTLAIPLQLAGTWIVLAWLLESLLIALIASTIGRITSFAFAVIVFAVGAIKLFADSFDWNNRYNLAFL